MIRYFFKLVFLGAIVAGATVASPLFDMTSCVAQDKTRVIEVEVVFSGGSQPEHQKWAETLSEIGADFARLKSARDSVQPSIKESDEDGQTYIQIVGILDSRGILNMLGKKFTVRDKNKLVSLIQQLRDDGAKVTVSEKMAFGLTAEQLVAVSEDLAVEFDELTKDQKVSDVYQLIRQKIKTPIVLDGAAKRAIAGEEVVAEELQGLSAGTVLAAVIRPLGMVAVPRRPQGKSVELVIVDSRSTEEHWPIGWPIQQSNLATAPSLFEKLDVEINDFVLDETLAAIQGRVDIPFLYDQNAMARHGIELGQVKVTMVKKQQTYYAVLRKILSQTRPQLKFEIRVDEAQKPFLWISTMR